MSNFKDELNKSNKRIIEATKGYYRAVRLGRTEFNRLHFYQDYNDPNNNDVISFVFGNVDNPEFGVSLNVRADFLRLPIELKKTIIDFEPEFEQVKGLYIVDSVVINEVGGITFKVVKTT